MKKRSSKLEKKIPPVSLPPGVAEEVRSFLRLCDLGKMTVAEVRKLIGLSLKQAEFFARFCSLFPCDAVEVEKALEFRVAVLELFNRKAAA